MTTETKPETRAAARLKRSRNAKRRKKLEDATKRNTESRTRTRPANQLPTTRVQRWHRRMERKGKNPEAELEIREKNREFEIQKAIKLQQYEAKKREKSNGGVS